MRCSKIILRQNLFIYLTLRKYTTRDSYAKFPTNMQQWRLWMFAVAQMLAEQAYKVINVFKATIKVVSNCSITSN